MATKKSSMYLETTTVEASRSIGEITAALVRGGARSIETMYEGGKATGLSWSMMIYGQIIYFRMPAKTEPVFQFLYKRVSGKLTPQRSATMREQAERIAWRQMLAWVHVQMTLVELGMVEYAQVFLPYVSNGQNGETMWDAARETRFKQLEAPQ